MVHYIIQYLCASLQAVDKRGFVRGDSKCFSVLPWIIVLNTKIHIFIKNSIKID